MGQHCGDVQGEHSVGRCLLAVAPGGKQEEAAGVLSFKRRCLLTSHL